MRKLKNLILPFLIIICLFSSCSTSEDDPNNNPPGLFSAYAFDTTVDGASVEWTESIDTDDDLVTYAIILEGEEVTSGLTKGQIYTFSGLEPETIYAGYVEARDGRGGTSRAEFSFVTEPEVIIFNVNASWWIFRETPEGAGLRRMLSAGFEVPYYEKATGYKIEIIDYAFAGTVRINSQDQNGKIYTWTNETRSDLIGPVKQDQDISEGFGVFIAGGSINTLNSSYAQSEANFAATIGEATVTVTIGK